jgi:hypothetical protein
MRDSGNFLNSIPRRQAIMMGSIMEEFSQEEKQKACWQHNRPAKRTDSLNQFS